MKPSIWQSRKFWIMIFDTVISLIINVGCVYVFPSAKDMILVITGILQAPILFVIGAIAYEDGVFMKTQSNETMVNAQLDANKQVMYKQAAQPVQ
jgi:hypothetical protein